MSFVGKGSGRRPVLKKELANKNWELYAENIKKKKECEELDKIASEIVRELIINN